LIVPTSIRFDPPLAPTVLEVRDFYLGSSDGKGRDGRGYPAHMRALWRPQVRAAIIEIAWSIGYIPNAQINAAKEGGKVFGSVLVVQPQRRVRMQLVRIERFTQYLNEPRKLFVKFDSMSETRV